VRWLIDECVDADLVALLRQSGHDAVYMCDVAPRSTDVEVMHRADSENRLLLTEDKDFGDLVFRQAKPVPGIVLLRIDSSRRSHKGPRLLVANYRRDPQVMRPVRQLNSLSSQSLRDF
jgi:predicted nuclease of predicted toxin-antitoxin system